MVRRLQESGGRDIPLRVDEWPSSLSFRSRSLFIGWRIHGEDRMEGRGTGSPPASRALSGNTSRLLKIRILLFYQGPLVVYTHVWDQDNLCKYCYHPARESFPRKYTDRSADHLRYTSSDRPHRGPQTFFSCTALLQACPALALSPPSGSSGRYSMRLSSKVTSLRSPSFPSTTFRT